MAPLTAAGASLAAVRTEAVVVSAWPANNEATTLAEVCVEPLLEGSGNGPVVAVGTVVPDGFEALTESPATGPASAGLALEANALAAADGLGLGPALDGASADVAADSAARLAV